MNLAEAAHEAARFLTMGNPAWAPDYDAPGLPLEERLRRLHLALILASRASAGTRGEAEITYALHDCEALIALPLADVEEIKRAHVGQRLARMKRVLAYHEVQGSRRHRRLNWIPLVLILMLLTVCLYPDVLSLFK